VTYREALTALDALYAALPTVPCKRQCQASCGVIVMTRFEWVRMQRKLGYKPKGKPTLICPMLKHGACSVHSIRPLICRLWGCIDDPMMRCPFGCQPSAWLTMEDSRRILSLGEAISRAIYPEDEATAWAQGLNPDEIETFIGACQRLGLMR